MRDRRDKHFVPTPYVRVFQLGLLLRWVEGAKAHVSVPWAFPRLGE